MTYRDDSASLRAEVERLTRELASAREPRRRWRVRSSGYGPLVGSTAGIAYSTATGDHGTLAQRVGLGAAVLAACLVMWALCFVRRMPVDGGGE